MSAEARVTIELNPREQRLYDRLRRCVVERDPRDPSGFRDVLLLLPDFAVLLLRLLADPRVPAGGKALALVGIGYLLSPVDLVPALLFGPLGAVDDLLVVSAATSRILNHVHPDVVRCHWPGQGDALHAIQRVTAWSEELFGQRLRALVGRVLGRA